ncbi:uncharacterized protein LY89DRAFT_684659 [Mollisia scopiformis]|uniref:Uncharacterized protein n=1 Tax=Mollisia scopiformis TaxID=149040 RepID=A0A194XBZ8_MOLSC|nr:uncharacterized protein LY89DRAFT_684659 [Mollisia scopiformis]KUJ17689.1 hypothetical protein LY89DRAFT_684659 [Mollisia scopiformis]
MRQSLIISVLSFAAASLACGLHGLHGRDTIDSDPQFAPIPSTAVGIPLRPEGYAVQSFGGGAYMVTDGMYQGTNIQSCQMQKFNLSTSFLPCLHQRCRGG